MTQPYNDEELEQMRTSISGTGPISRLFATIDALHEQLGWRRCIRCKQLRPPHGTRDRHGREAGFYNVNGSTDATCADCRRYLAHERYMRNWPFRTP